MSHTDDADEYDATFVAGLEFMWGEGFLSPGGQEEVAAILDRVVLSGKRVLDIGCGLGGVDLALVRAHGAAEVVGIDVEAPLVERARALIAREGLSGQIDVRHVEPGPLQFEPASFDVVFSKDAIIHIADKQALYADVLRVLRPGGLFVGSDWLRGGGDLGEAMLAWLEVVGLHFEMSDLEKTRAALRSAGFVDVVLNDRNAWYAQEIEREVARTGGSNRAALTEAMGEPGAEARLHSNALRLQAVQAGELRPTHFRGAKP